MTEAIFHIEDYQGNVKQKFKLSTENPLKKIVFLETPIIMRHENGVDGSLTIQIADGEVKSFKPNADIYLATGTGYRFVGTHT